MLMYQLVCLSQFQLGTSRPGNPRGLAQKNCPGDPDLTFESCPGAGNSTSVMINTWCPKKLLKMENTALLISNSNYAKRHINVCSGGDLCSPFFSNVSETPSMKVGFDVRISLV